jgi:hypothetical protein
MVTIPLSVVAEYLVWGEIGMGWIGAGGSLLIFTGFALLISSSSSHSTEESSQERLLDE